MYTVLVSFRDLQDDGYRYHAGDVFPRPGMEVTEARINELSTAANRLKKPLIKAEAKPEVKVEKPKTEKPKAEKPKADKPKKGKKRNAH